VSASDDRRALCAVALLVVPMFFLSLWAGGGPVEVPGHRGLEDIAPVRSSR